MEKYLQVGVCKVGAGESEGELTKWSKPGVRAVATQHGASAAYANLEIVLREERKKDIVCTSSCSEPFLCRVFPPEHS